MLVSRRGIAGLLLLALLSGPASGDELPDPEAAAAGTPADAAAAGSAATTAAAVEAVEAYYRGDLESSLRAYREILRADPWDLSARWNLVRILREAGRPEEALGHLELLSVLRPREDAPRLQAAEAALQAGKAERALGYLQTVGATAQAGYLAGLALLELGRSTEAAAALELSLQREPFRPLAWYRLGLARYELGELEWAEEALRTALAQEPNLTGCLPALARIYLAQGLLPKAYSLARRALAGRPGSLPLQELLQELEARDPSLLETARVQQQARRETAVPRKAEARPQDAGSLPALRIGLCEKVQELHLKTGGGFCLAAAPEAGAVPPAPAGPAGQVLRARCSEGLVELADADGQVLLRSAGPVRLSYEDPADTTLLFDVQYGQGTFWAGSEDRMYRGAIELAPRGEGLTVVNVLSVEEYLYSVLPSEMPSSWPAAALQAQAVAARSYTLANLGRFADRGFDLLGSVASAAYRGLGAETAAARAAVDATRGLVLTEGGEPLAAYYSANCGGYSDTTETAWGFPSSLPAVPDPLQAERAVPLDPEQLARWLSDRPAAYCSQPDYSARSAYRWQLWVSREEIERRLQAPELGSLLAIVPAGRGLSGRASEVRVAGSSGQLTVRWDAVRRRLGGLRSNLFVVEPQLGADGLPEGFLFTGAGWGHGVGLCQSGAAGMAAAGWSAEQILRHYYGDAALRRLF
jgi:stage II sporulation protein D